MIKAPTILLLALLAAPFAIAPALADSCVDLRTGQNYDCNGPPPSSAAGKPADQTCKPPTSQLREEIRQRLNSNSARASTKPIKDRIENASDRADNALLGASRTSDPREKAQFKRDYVAAMSDLRNAGNELVGATSDPAEKERLRQALQASEARHAQMAADAGIDAASAPPQQAAAPALKDVFTVCEAPEKGVTTCFELGRAGSACRKVYYQGGEATWRDDRMSTCADGDLEQRDAYFAGAPVGTGPAPDTRNAELEKLMTSLPSQCQEDLKSFMYSSRDGATSRSSSDKAVSSFRNVNSNAECRAGMEKLAEILGVQLPRRQLADADRQAFVGALADRPRETVNVPSIAEYYGQPTSGQFDMGEVLSTGAALLNLLSGVLGVVAGSYSSAPSYSSGPARGYGGPSGSGYVYRGSSQGNRSTITGGSR